MLPDQLQALGVRRGVLLQAARLGLITNLQCDMDDMECLYPSELGGKGYFQVKPPILDWIPTPEHPGDGSLLTVDNVRLAHGLCNRVNGAKHGGRSYARDLAKVETLRQWAQDHPEEAEVIAGLVKAAAKCGRPAIQAMGAVAGSLIGESLPPKFN